MTMINLGDYDVLCNPQELADLLNNVVDMSLIANTNYDVDGGGAFLDFYAPFDLNMTVTDYDDDTRDKCKHNITCVGSDAWRVELTKWQEGYFAFASCVNGMMRANAVTSGLNSLTKSWRRKEVAFFYSELGTAYSAYVPDVAETTLGDKIEGMITSLVENGYNRQDIIVLLNPATASEYRKTYGACCQLYGTNVTDTDIANKFGVRRVVECGADLTADVFVYVQDYALFGTFCKALPSAWEGTDEYKNRALIGGEEGFGAGVYDSANSGLKYTA